MSKLASKRIKRPRRFLAVGLVALLAGCSSIPDAVNPVEWYKDTRDFVFGKDGQSQAPENPRNQHRAERGQAAPGADKPFPELNTVPERPRALSRVRRGLVPDREGARRYSRDAIRRQGEPVNPLRTSPQTPPEAAAPSTAPRIETPPRAATPSPRPRPPAAAAPVPKPAPQAAPIPQARSAAPAPSAPRTPRGGEFETVVISGADVQTAGGADAASRVGGVQSLSDFNPAAVRGSYQVATIQFGDGSARLNARDRQIIRQVFAQQRQTGGTVRIVGHASRGTATKDEDRHKLVKLRVSAARADAVAGELIRIGARPGSLFVGGVADRYPRYHEYMPSGEAGNRRAEIFIDFL